MSAILPRRIFGPDRSPSTATGWWNRAAASRMRSSISLCSSSVPCEKLSRHTSTPASNSRYSTSTSAVAGPRVARILVRIMAAPIAVARLKLRRRRANVKGGGRAARVGRAGRSRVRSSGGGPLHRGLGRGRRQHDLHVRLLELLLLDVRRRAAHEVRAALRLGE